MCVSLLRTVTDDTAACEVAYIEMGLYYGSVHRNQDAASTKYASQWRCLFASYGKVRRNQDAESTAYASQWRRLFASYGKVPRNGEAASTAYHR